MSQSKLITTENVPAALDRAINALTGLRATYTEERTDTGSNETGDVAYLNAAHDCALITRQLQHDMLQAAADRVGEPVETFDISCVMEMEGVDTDILGELREMLDERFHQIGCREYNTKPKSQPFPISETSPTSHLLVRNGRLV